MKKQRYKALMLDLDGTTIPNKREGLPSKNVQEAIAKAQKKLHVGAVTGRPYAYTKHLFGMLNFNGPSIVGGGTAIVNVEKQKILWEKKISKQDIERMLPIFSKIKGEILFLDEVDQEEHVYNARTPIKPQSLITLPDLHPLEAERIEKELKIFSDIATHKIVGWKNNTVWVQITHIEASKQYAIFEVAKLLQIETHEIIGVGDSYNDFPLLMACGLKIAMGNAVPELKAIADYIAPTVEDDGVVDIIEKFVL